MPVWGNFNQSVHSFFPININTGSVLDLTENSLFEWITRIQMERIGNVSDKVLDSAQQR